MSKPATPADADSVDATIKSLIAATQFGRDEALQVWTQRCDLYARYFAALGKAEGLDGVIAANSELMTASLEAFKKGASAWRPLNGAAPKAP